MQQANTQGCPQAEIEGRRGEGGEGWGVVVVHSRHADIKMLHEHFTTPLNSRVI
jgi:hypothetical protein